MTLEELGGGEQIRKMVQKYGTDRTEGYYAVVPVHILQDQELTDGAKLLYGEISALASKHGYCYATDAYLAKRLGRSDKTIRRNLSLLEEGGKIRRETTKDGKGTRRKIYISPQGG